MSAAGQLRDLVESVVKTLTGETERRLDELEAKVKYLEDRLSPPEAAAAARSGTAKAAGTASPGRPRKS